MKKFSIYISILLVSIFVILIGLDSIYTYVFKNGTPRNKLAYLMSIENKKIDYVFIGSSRVDNTVDAEVIEDITGKTALNLGVQGGKIDDFFMLLQLLKKQNVQTEVIFIQIDYVFNMEGNSEILKSNLMPYIEESFLSDYIKERSSDYFFLKNVPFYRYMKYDYKIGFREFFNTWMGNKHNTDLSNGYMPKFGNSGQALKGSLPNFVKSKNKNFEDIKKFAKENNLKIVYFMAPFCSATKNLDFGSKLKKKIPGFLDFSTMYIDHDEYFFNCSHLNAKGARNFSKLLANTIKNNDF